VLHELQTQGVQSNTTFNADLCEIPNLAHEYRQNNVNEVANVQFHITLTKEQSTTEGETVRGNYVKNFKKKNYVL
jgi:hypothetical protein